MLDELSIRFLESGWESVRNKWMGERYLRMAGKVAGELGGYDQKVLDFGCGEGQVSWILSQMGMEVVGVELAAHTQWRRVPEVDWVVYGGRDLPFGPATFAGVTMFGVLEHVGPDPKSQGVEAWKRNQEARRISLRECQRVLVPGGKVWIFNFPNPDSPVEKLNDLIKPRVVHRGSERQRLAEVVELVASSGLAVVEAGRSGVLPAAVGNMSPWVREQLANRWHRELSKWDVAIDKALSQWWGQSNWIVAEKR